LQRDFHDQTPSSASHLSDELDIDSVLRALASEVTGTGDEAEDRPALPLQQLTQNDESLLGANWFGPLSRRSSAISMSVHSEEMSLAFPSPTSLGHAEASASPSQAEQDFQLQEEILQSVDAATWRDPGSQDEPVGDVTEDMISVVDIGDDVSPDADSIGQWPYMSPRPLEHTVVTLLRRLSSEHQADESVTSSIRGVLEISELLAEAEPHLTEEEIGALPCFPYAGKEKQQCAICLEHFQEKQLVTMLRCTHFFHMECVTAWMHRATKCPLCRASC